MKILVTGAKGFVGKNLVVELRNRGYTDVYECGRETDNEKLDEYCKDVDFVFHLAGVNRPEDPSEFKAGNIDFLSKLLYLLKEDNNYCPILFSSSIQATLDNPYGKSKKLAEDLLLKYGEETGAPVLIYRLPNVFGKWCRPNYNSVVATFCYNISHDIPIIVNDQKTSIKLVYIDDVIKDFLRTLANNELHGVEFINVSTHYTVTLEYLTFLLKQFKQSRMDNFIPDMSDQFTKKLYSTYLSYLPKGQFCYDLKMNVDARGSFTEFIKTQDRGQVSINISKPGITKGEHWHHTKNEKFLVVSGEGVIRFRKVGSDEVLEYFVNGNKLSVVDIPTGYTHNIQNLGKNDMVTVMWANELLDPKNTDTFFLKV